METIKITSQVLLETEFTVPKYFKIANHYHMILDDKNYLFVKANLESSLLIYPEISILQISWSANRWHQNTISQDLIAITEEEFKEEYNNASIYFQTILIEEKWNQQIHKTH
jgi:hypothetical protein